MKLLNTDIWVGEHFKNMLLIATENQPKKKHFSYALKKSIKVTQLN